MKKTVLILLIGFILSGSVIGQEVFQYQVMPGDNLWKIADRFYDCALLYNDLYEFNQVRLDSVWDLAIQDNPLLKQLFPDKKDFLEVGTVIVLPDSLFYRNVIYFCNVNGIQLVVKMEKVDSIKISASEVIARFNSGSAKISIRSLLAGFQQIDELILIDSLPEPYDNFDVVSIISQDTIDRGVEPAWFENPQTPFQKFAKRLALHYSQLKYTDCFIITSRICDAYREDWAKLENIKLPDELPFEVFR